MIRIKRVCDPSIDTPAIYHSGDAGYDLRSVSDNIIYPDERIPIYTGFAWEIPFGFCGLVKSRSGLAVNHSIHAFHGLIDSGYRAEIKVSLTNYGERRYEIKKNDRIAQLVIVPIYIGAEIVEVESLSDSDRMLGGFGSTGA